MMSLRRVGRFSLDLGAAALRHPAWFVRNLGQQLLQVRANSTARFRYRLPAVNHDRLDPRLERLPVEVGSAASVDYSKAFIIARFCRLLAPRRVLEIGTFRGGMTRHIARNTPADARIWTLDLPRAELGGMVDRMIASDVAMASMDASRVGEEWRNQPEAQKITQLWGDSMTFDFSALPPLDLIYIDGSHAEPWVARDTENAFRMLAPTGAILWDDCYWADVQRVLGRYVDRHPIYLFEDNQTAGYLRIDGQDQRAT